VRLLHIITNRFPAGPEDTASPFVRDFVSALSKNGVEVEVTSPRYSADTADGDPGARINWLPWSGSKEVIGATNLFNPLDVLALARFLHAGRGLTLEALASRRPNHCLALWALPSGWFALEAKRRLGVPYSVWCLGSDIYKWARRPIAGRITKSVLREADHLFADGHDLCRKTEQLSGRRCTFLPSLRLLPKVELTADGDPSRNDPERPFAFLYVGRLERSKGVFHALDAFTIARAQQPKMSLGFLGWGPDERLLKKRAAGLLEDVQFLGAGGPAEVARAMKSSHCLIVPSLSDSIPLVFGEALQAKIPLIVTDVGDMGELVTGNDLGAVVPPGDIQAMACEMAAVASYGPPPGYPERMDRLLRALDPEVAAETFLGAVSSQIDT
jgi:glycosyltransferase involved in cell wall biosynthesis